MPQPYKKAHIQFVLLVAIVVLLPFSLRLSNYALAVWLCSFLSFSKKSLLFKLSSAVVWIGVYFLFLKNLANESLLLFAILLTWHIQTHFQAVFKLIKEQVLPLLLLLFFVWHIVGLFWTDELIKGFSNLETKLPLLAIPLFLPFQNLKKVQTQKTLHFFVLSCLFASLVSLAYAAYQGLETEAQNLQAVWNYFSYIPLCSLLGIHPTYFGLYSLFCILILGVSFLKKEEKSGFLKPKMRIFLLLYFSLFLMLLSARILILGYALFLFVFVMFLFFNQKNKAPYAVLLLFFAGFLGWLVWKNPITHFRLIQELKETNFELKKTNTSWNSTNLRLLNWQASWQLIQEQPLLGVGTGDSRSELQKKYETWQIGIFKESLAGTTHNQYLQTMLTLGLFGFSLLILLLGKGFLTAFQTKNDLLLAFLAMLVLVMLTESVLEKQKGILFFSLFLGLLSKLNTV